MEKSFQNIKKVTSRLGGYHYEFQVGALRLLDLLEGKADKIEFESAIDSKDCFDDIKIFYGDRIHHYQVKWGLTRKSIRLSDFVNSSSNLCFSKLFDTWKLYSESPSKKHVFHIYSSKNTDQHDELCTYFLSPKEEEVRFSDNKSNTYKLDLKILQLEKFSQIKAALEKDYSIDTIASFFDSLILEINQPDMSSNEESENRFGNPIQALLLERISDRLGLDKPPHNLRPTNILARLIQESYDSAIQQRPITRESLAQKIGIKLNLETIAQIFSFDEDHYVQTDSVKKLNLILKESSGKLIKVVGSPGSGKSNLLTFWKKQMEKSEIKPIMYYCFIGHEHHQDVRITQNQLLQDLITNILTHYPQLGSLEEHSLLAATPKRLQDLITNLGEQGRTKNQIIPIIIDGLDHVIRTRERYSQTLSAKTDLLEFFDCLDIPKGVAFVVGTQLGSHLDRIDGRFGDAQTMKVEGFTLNEARNFLERFGITTDSVSEEVIDSIIEKTAKLPLLLTYSVQANQELSLDERLLYLESKYHEMPETGGDVRIYYDWLWTGISSNPLTEHYARLLSVLDFPVSADLLENVISKPIRIGNSVDACMEPLVPLVRNTVYGTSFFHDSFAAYVFSEDAFSIEDKQWYFKNLYEYFNKIGLYSSDRAYVKGLEFAFKANLYQDIIDTITVDFIDQSLLNGFPLNQILTQIDFAIKSSIQIKDIPLLAKNCFLRKYTKDRLEYNYSPNEAANLFARLDKHQQLERLILANDSLNTDLSGTIDLLALCLENNVELPYGKIMSLWDSKIKEEIRETKKEPDITNTENYAKVISYVYGLEYALTWIEGNKDFKFEENVFEAIGRFASLDDAEKLIQEDKHGYRDLIIVFSHLIKTGNEKRAKTLLVNAFTQRNNITPYLVSQGIRLGIDKEVLERHCKIFVPAKPGSHSDYPRKKEIFEFRQFEKSVKSLTYCGKSDELRDVISIIRTYPLTAPRLLQEMIFLVSKIEGKIVSGSTDSSESNNLLVEFERFVKHTTLEGISPRDLDCTHLKDVAKHVLTKLVRCYLKITDKPDLKKLVELVLKLNNKFQWNSPGLDWLFVSTEHMTSCFVEIIKKYPDNTMIKQKIISVLAQTQIPAFTTSRVDYFLNVSDAYIKYDMKKESENAFVNAIKSTHAYGYRKDLFLDEIHEIAINLNKLNPSKALVRAADILDLSKYLWGVTDHKETRHIPSNVVQELLRLKTSVGFKLLRQFANEGFNLPFIQCVSFLAAEMSDSSLALRWNLVKNLSYGFSTEHEKSELIGIKFELVQLSINAEQSVLAKEIMENIREQIATEFDYCEKTWRMDFQKHAKDLGIKPILHDIKSCGDSDFDEIGNFVGDSKNVIEDSFAVDSKNVIEDGSVDEIIKQFDQLDKRQHYNAVKDLKIILENKIKNLEQQDLDKLTDFLNQRLSYDPTCGNLLRKIALCYKGKDDEKFLDTLFLAFDTYGWIGYGYPSIAGWLVEAYNCDSQKTMNYVLEGFAKLFADKYGPHGAIKPLTEFLYLTGQAEVLEKLYGVLYDFCKTFFRTYVENFDEFNWLRGTNFKKMTDEEMIEASLKSEHVKIN